jgi:UDP-galactopyranose mutase
MYSYSYAPFRSAKNETGMKEDIIIRGAHQDDRVQSIRKQACCYAPDHSQRFRTKYEDLPRNLDLFCFSHVRWDNVVQRPQQLMSRWARTHRVFFVEQPVVKSGPDFLQISKKDNGVRLITPHLNPHADSIEVQKKLLSDFISRHKIGNYICAYMSPSFLPYTSQLDPEIIVYDCMKAFSASKVTPEMPRLETDLMSIADLVFTGGLALYEAKCHLHQNIHAFPSSVDLSHFSKARMSQPDPIDQARIPEPRIGYFGVIDERIDQELIRAAAELRPDWHWIFVGPVSKIDPDKLPRGSNIHYLGKKDYKTLPSYLSGWDVTILPYARNDATRYLSPAKTAEYLAAGKPVVSTSIRDVVQLYGERGLVVIADEPSDFVKGIESSLLLGRDWLNKVDASLWNISWDQIWNRMNRLVAEAWYNRKSNSNASA